MGFRAPRPPQQVIPPSPPSAIDPSVFVAREERLRRTRGQRGIRGTILTGPGGVVEKRTILGRPALFARPAPGGLTK